VQWTEWSQWSLDQSIGIKLLTVSYYIYPASMSLYGGRWPAWLVAGRDNEAASESVTLTA